MATSDISPHIDILINIIIIDKDGVKIFDIMVIPGSSFFAEYFR